MRRSAGRPAYPGRCRRSTGRARLFGTISTLLTFCAKMMSSQAQKRMGLRASIMFLRPHLAMAGPVGSAASRAPSGMKAPTSEYSVEPSSQSEPVMLLYWSRSAAEVHPMVVPMQTAKRQAAQATSRQRPPYLCRATPGYPSTRGALH
ncbi:hypothetical protein FOCC_FOCC012547, partial [Frankliniella occidentalis]